LDALVSSSDLVKLDPIPDEPSEPNNRIVRFAGRYLPVALEVSGPAGAGVGFTLGGILGGSVGVVGVAVGIVGLGLQKRSTVREAGYIRNVRGAATTRQERLEQIETELSLALEARDTYAGNLRAVVDAFLGSVAEELGLGDCDRISLYRRSEDPGPGFYGVGRYSSNNAYMTLGRGFYPYRAKGSKQDIISKAWDVGYSEQNYRANPDRNIENYRSEVRNRQGLSDNTVAGLAMCSRCLHGHRISRKGDSTVNLGVIVFESTKQAISGPGYAAMSRPVLEKFLASNDGLRIAQFMERIPVIPPDLSLAQAFEDTADSDLTGG
jgi:hypothetical protein